MNNPSHTPVAANKPGPSPFSYQEQHIKFLTTILRGASAIGLFVVIFYIGHTTPTLAAVIIGAYLLLLVATFIPFPYSFRAGILLVIVFLLGFSALLRTGIYGDSRLFFLAFALLSALLFERREYFIAQGLSVAIIAGVGWLLTTGRITLTTHEVAVGSLSTWVVEILVLILVATVFEESWRRLRQEFKISQATLQNAMTILSNERANLESRITERTKEVTANAELAKKRADRLHAISELAYAIAFIQDPDELLQTISRLISERFGFYHVGIYLNDENGFFTILRAANSEGGQRLLSRGHKLKVGQAGIVNYVAATGEAHIAGNIKDDLLYDNNPDLPETRSVIALPLVIGQRIIGVLDLESAAESDVNEKDLDVMSMLANQVSAAIENTRLFSETRRALSEARVVYGHYMRQAWEQLSGEKRTPGYRYAAAKVNVIENPIDLPEIQSALKTGQSAAPSSENPTITIPLKLRDEVIGVLDIRSSNPARQWTENEMALVQAIAERVALALENARLFEETTRRADRERAVSEITTRIRSTTDPQLMLQTALDELKRALGAKDIQIRPYSPPPADQNVK